ncbi:MAG: M48 family metallopeptidase [Bacillota bacterium]
MKPDLIHSGDIAISLRRVPRARHLRLSVDGSGSVLLTRPLWVSRESALSFLKEKEAWLRVRIEEIRSRPASILHSGGREEYLRYKEKARLIVRSRLQFYNSHYGFNIIRISIRDQKSRWGSCSHAGGLNFNYRLALLPADLADYIIVHELCHLKEMNHSPAFWRLVGEKIPDYQEKRRRLRKI